MNEATIEATNPPISHPERPTATTSPQVTAPRNNQTAKSGTSQARLGASTLNRFSPLTCSPLAAGRTRSHRRSAAKSATTCAGEIAFMPAP